MKEVNLENQLPVQAHWAHHQTLLHHLVQGQSDTGYQAQYVQGMTGASHNATHKGVSSYVYKHIWFQRRARIQKWKGGIKPIEFLSFLSPELKRSQSVEKTSANRNANNNYKLIMAWRKEDPPLPFYDHS